LTRFSALLWPCALIALGLALYLPFLGNPLVFDDTFFFSGRNFARYATTPLGLELRLPGYFSLALVHVLWGGIEAHRLVSLALHLCVALALYKLVLDLLRHAAPAAPARLAAFAAAAAFAVHPVAVYGAAYLIQRTGLLATLFSLLSVIFFFRGLRESRHADAVTAAAMFSLAVLSKETAVLVPAAALLLAFTAERRFALRHAAIYAAACIPAALLAVLLVKGKIGATYEPDFAVVAQQVGAQAGGAWLQSVATQLELFFRYLALWLWPDTGTMSIDVRVDLASGLFPGLPAFVAYGAFCAYLLTRGGRAAMAGVGLLYVWLLYLVELTTVRFADPFVLYRSYLWAPGLAVALAAVLSSFPARFTLPTLVVALPLLALQAHDRLQSFSSGLALWQDAADKLPSRPVPGGSRTLYQLGREYFYRGETGKAMAVVDRCIAQYPKTYDCYFARAAIHVELEQYETALPFIARAAELRPESGSARHLLGFALESLGREDEAKMHYRAALKLGFHGAAQRLKRLEDPGSGLLPPTRSAKPPPG
jgi:tetratricopeptide (TPR) repeat protein